MHFGIILHLLHIGTVSWVIQITFCVNVISIYLCDFQFKFDNLIHPNCLDRFRIPWDWRTPSTFLAAVCLQCFWLFITALMLVCSLSLFGSCCMALCTNAIDIRECFLHLQCIDAPRASTGNYANIHAVLFETILFHAKSIELSFYWRLHFSFEWFATWTWTFCNVFYSLLFFSFTKRLSKAYGYNLTVVFLLSSTLLCLVLLNLDEVKRLILKTKYTPNSGWCLLLIRHFKREILLI